ARDDAGFTKAIEAVTLTSLQRGVAKIDFDALVLDAWREEAATVVLDKQVDASVKAVRKEAGLASVLKSIVSRERAKELALEVAQRTYRSDTVKRLIERIAVRTAGAVGQQIELATVDAAGPARKCLEAFLGTRFGQAIAGVVGAEAGDPQITPNAGQATVSTGALLANSRGGIAGVMVLIVRRQLAKMAARVGQRILGAVLSRVVSVVAGGIGLVLIAKDIWDFRNGVLPIIAGEMKSSKTKALVRTELSKTIKTQIDANVATLARKSAVKVVGIWQDFRRAHAKVLAFAEKDPAFKRFLDRVPPDRLARLDEIVGLIAASEGDDAVLARLRDGTLQQAVTKLNPTALRIAREKRSLAEALQWQALAGDAALPNLIKYDVHRRAQPIAFTKQGLTRLLALQDQLAISRLVEVDQQVRGALLELETDKLKNLARALTPNDLIALARYNGGLAPAVANRVLEAVARKPSLMQSLGKPWVRDAVIRSADQAAAADLMLNVRAVFDPQVFYGDVRLVQQQKVDPWLLWERYPMAVSGLALGLFFVLLIFWRILFGRRRRRPAAETPA
ncbi:MAG: hypothetical protein AAFR04_11335, partial [Pseudomonadota bacterium]